MSHSGLVTDVCVTETTVRRQQRLPRRL